jgi:hypothetical protein
MGAPRESLIHQASESDGHDDFQFSPDSAIPADAMSEEQTFLSEVNGSLPLSGHRPSVVQDEI